MASNRVIANQHFTIRKFCVISCYLTHSYIQFKRIFNEKQSMQANLCRTQLLLIRNTNFINFKQTVRYTYWCACIQYVLFSQIIDSILYILICLFIFFFMNDMNEAKLIPLGNLNINFHINWNVVNLSLMDVLIWLSI